MGILHRRNAFSTVQTVYSIALHQRFSIPLLAPPRSAYFVCYSYRFRYLFYSNVSALRSGHHRVFRHDSSSKRTYIFHSKCIEVCKTWIKIVYIYRGIWCLTRPCVKTFPLKARTDWRNAIRISATAFHPWLSLCSVCHGVHCFSASVFIIYNMQAICSAGDKSFNTSSNPRNHLCTWLQRDTSLIVI